MTKTVIRISAVLAAAVLTFLLLAAAAAVPAAYASSDALPKFTITCDRESADTGTQIIVSVAMDNDTPDDITNFAGSLQFDTRFFRYQAIEDQISMDGSVSVVPDLAGNGKLDFVYIGTDISNTRINCGDSVVFIKFIFSVVAAYDTTGQFFVGVVNDCYQDTVNLGVINCETQSITVRSTTTAAPTSVTTAPLNLSGDARLASLTVEGCTLTPAFNAEFVAYSAAVPYETTEIRINASPSFSGAIVSGIGAKDLAVGMNNFTVTVLAEDGTVREYGIIITRQEMTVPSTSVTESTQPTETTTSAEIPVSTAPIVSTTYTQPDGSTVIDGQDGDSAKTDGILQIVGIVFGEIALFFFGFLSGFFVDKNLRRKGERIDYDDGYYDDDDDGYDDRVPTVYTPGDQMYADGSYIDPGYPAAPPYADPQMIQYAQFGQGAPMGPEPVDPGFIPFAPAQPFDPQTAQFVQNPPFDPQGQGQPVYPEDTSDPYYH